MKAVKYLTLFCACFALLTGCGATVTMLNSAYPAKPLNANIDFFYTQKPSCEYSEIAIIEGDNYFSSDNDAINQIKVKAREIGADAVIFMGSANTFDNTYGSTTKTGNNTHLSTTHSTEEYGIKAMAIKYKN